MPDVPKGFFIFIQIYIRRLYKLSPGFLKCGYSSAETPHTGLDWMIRIFKANLPFITNAKNSDLDVSGSHDCNDFLIPTTDL